MKRPPRFALQSAPDENGIARVASDEAHHMRDVMRLQPGDAISLIDESGASHLGTIVKFDRAGAEVRVGTIEPALRFYVVFFLTLLVITWYCYLRKKTGPGQRVV